MTDPIIPTPKPPDDNAPLTLDKTPSHFPVTAQYVTNKLAERDETRGRPVVNKALTPFFLAGFTLCGSVTTVAMSFEGVIPRPVLIVAAIGSMFFGAMLGIGPGLRK